MDAKMRADFINGVADTSEKKKPGNATVDPQAFASDEADSSEINEEAKGAFAQGLPSWDLVPPQMPVRRKR